MPSSALPIGGRAPRLRLAAAWLIGVNLGTVALAQPALDVAWSGYGSLSAYRADIRGATLKPDVQFAGGTGDGSWALDGDSRVAVQGRLTLGASTEAVLQLSSSNAQEQHFRPAVEWAYVDWHPDGQISLRIGRQTLPVLRYSESRYVAYAQAAVRPQPAVYVLNTGAPVDGINLSWELGSGEHLWRLDLGAGTSSARVSGRRVDVKRSLVGALQWQHGAWTGRVAAADFQVDLDIPRLLSASLEAQCANCADVLPQRAASRGLRGRLVTAMLVWDQQPWEWSVEAIARPSSSSVLIPRAQGAYLQASRRFDRWQGQAAVGRLRYREPALGLQAGAAAPAAAQASLDLLDRYLQSPFDMDTRQLGLRLDLAPGLALKLQRDWWRATRDTRTGRNWLVQLASPPLGSQPSSWNGRAQLTTLSLDAAF